MKINITLYKDINEVLSSFAHGIDTIFKQNLIGLYLLGSLTYGDFNPRRSDIDLVAIVRHQVTVQELELIKELHKKIKKNYQVWADRLECSYIPIDMLITLSPPKAPRPYYNCGTFFTEAHYGNEWIINNYLLYEHGISLFGPDFKELINAIDIAEVQKACIRDLFQEWEPKIIDPEWLGNGHYQSYIILNLCRILYTVMQRPTGSKTVAASWVKNEFGSQWQDLIEVAEQWQYGKEMTLQKEVILFIKFVMKKVSETQLMDKVVLQDVINGNSK